jgi:hypothetical protein
VSTLLFAASLVALSMPVAGADTNTDHSTLAPRIDPRPTWVRKPLVIDQPNRASAYDTPGHGWPEGFAPQSFDWAQGVATRGSNWRVAGVGEAPPDLFRGFTSLAWEPFVLASGSSHIGGWAAVAGVVLRDWGPASFRQPARPGIEWRTDHLIETGVRLHYNAVSPIGVDYLVEVTWTSNRRATPVADPGASPAELALASGGKRTVYPSAFVRLEIGFGIMLLNGRLALSFAEGGLTLTTVSFAIPLSGIWAVR